MLADIHSIALVIDDNPAELDLLTIGWTNAGHDQSISIHSCTSCKEAVFWLHEWKTPNHVVSGVLVDLMLFDAAGRAAVDVLSELPMLDAVPIIVWTGIDFAAEQTSRIRKSATRVWKKPGSWSGYGDFIRRFYNVLDSRNAPSSLGLLTE
jgi:CheY-like chemotaxis protein